MLKNLSPLAIGGITAVIAAVIIVLTLIFTPDANPAYDTAVDFMNAAGQGDDGTALILLSEQMRNYALENCPNGLPSGCIDDYTPPEWGGLIAAVFRRAIPDGSDAWDVQLVATYEEGQGFAGVCIYHRVERNPNGDWRITAWSGYVSCDEPNSGLQSLRRTDAPNYVPPVVTGDESAPEATPETTPEATDG